MKKLFSISRKQTTIVITLVILSVAALWYYMDYIPNNERALDEEHFRWLQKADENIRSKIVGIDTLLLNLLKVYISKNDTVKDYISNYPIPNVSLTCSKQPLNDALSIPKKKKGSGNTQLNTTDTNSVKFILNRDSSTNKLTLSATKKIPEKDSQYTVMMTSDFESFIKPILIPGLFDHYVVFYEGKYIYEDFHSGLGYNIKNEDSLLQTGKAMTGENIIKERVGGLDYQIFFQPINFFSSGKLIVAGLLSQERIDAEKKQLPAGIIVLAVTIALGILLFLPWIKIYFQGKYDKIDLNDAAASVVVAKLLISLIVLLLFTYNLSFRPDTKDTSKEVLADTIGSSFEREVDSAYVCLGKFDSVIEKDTAFYDVINLGTNAIKHNDKENIFDAGEYELLGNREDIKNLCSNLNYFELNWLDSNGNLKYGWTTAAENNIHSNYKDRDYFKKIQNGSTVSLKGEPDSIPIVLDQLVSRTSGTFRTIISKRSCLDSLKDEDKAKRAKVVALSFTMKCLDSVIMPAGYSFAIIDYKGNVKYHSKPDRNLNENLLEEFSNKEELDDALNGGFTENFQTKYYEGDYSVLATPLKGFPYFIVIMSDQSFPAAVQIETFSFTWGMVILFLLVVILDLVVLIAASSRRSLFKKQYLVTSWLWPRECSQQEYRTGAIGNIVLAAVLILIPLLFPHFFNYLSYLFLLFFSIPLSSIFINSLFLHKYRREKNEAYKNYKVNCNIYSTVFLVILNVFAFVSMNWTGYWHVGIFEITVLLAVYISLLLYKPTGNISNATSGNEPTGNISNATSGNEPTSNITNTTSGDKRTAGKINNPNPSEKKNFVTHYTCMIFSRLLITSAIPAVFFYVASYNFENNLLARYRQYDFVTQLRQKFPGKLFPDKLKYIPAIYPDSTWIISVTAKDSSCYYDTLKTAALTKSDSNTAKLFNAFGFYIEDISSVNDDNFYKSSADDYLCFNNFFDSVLYGHAKNMLLVKRKAYTPEIKEKDTTKAYLKINSGNFNYTFPPMPPNNGFLFWPLLAAVLYAYYLVLREVIKKVCSLNLGPIPVLKEMNTTINSLLNNDKQSSLWIVGLPVDETAELIRTKISNVNTISSLDFNDITVDSKQTKDISLQLTEENTYTFNLKPADNKTSAWKDAKTKVINDTNSFVLILNIENSLDDRAINVEKLNCLRELLAEGKKIRIISYMHPLKMLEILNRNKNENEMLHDTTPSKLMYSVLYKSPVIVLPFIKNEPAKKDENEPEKKAQPDDKVSETKYTGFLKKLRNGLLFIKNKSAKKVQPNGKVLELFLDKETKYTVFLEELRKELSLEEIKARPKKLWEDLLTLRIQFLANNFYMNIWCSLSSDERFILYDLALDGLVNITNTFAVGLLMNKGLIIEEEGCLHIFNRSFRNFILTSIDDKELAHLQMLHRKHSNWSNLQGPLLMVVLVVFVFLAIAQEGLYSRVIGIVTGIAAGIPALLKLLSMLGVQNGKEIKDEEKK